MSVMNASEIWLVLNVPYAFRESHLIVHENGIFVASSGERATTEEIWSVAYRAVYHLHVARRMMLNAAWASWRMSEWDMV